MFLFINFFFSMDGQYKNKPVSLIRKALYFATEAHEGQVRSGSGEPYIVHPVEVAKLVRKYKKSNNIKSLIIAALLHDVDEDTDYTLSDIMDRFGELVASIVSELTSDPELIKQYTKKVYLANKMVEMSSWALSIKLCDRLHNVSDLNDLKEKRRNRIISDTHYIICELRERRHLTQTHIKIIDDIEKTLKIYEL